MSLLRSSLVLGRSLQSSVRCFSSTAGNVIFVLGAPGSGKGKHSDHLVAKFGGCHVSVGEILREVLVCVLHEFVDGEDSREVYGHD